MTNIGLDLEVVAGSPPGASAINLGVARGDGVIVAEEVGTAMSCGAGLVEKKKPSEHVCYEFSFV